MVLYGPFDSGFVLLRAVVAEDLVGSEKASRGVGLMFSALGFAYLSGIPLAGNARYLDPELVPNFLFLFPPPSLPPNSIWAT